MKEFSRRDFLKVVGEMTKYGVISPIFDVVGIKEKIIPNTKVSIVGPKLELRGTAEGSPGDRAICFDEEDYRYGIVGVQQGKIGEVHTTNDAGNTWKEAIVPVSRRDYVDPNPSVRFIEKIKNAENKILVVHDFSCALGVRKADGSYDFTKVYPDGLNDFRRLSVACSLPDGRIIMGGDEGLFMSLSYAKLSDIEKTIEYNRVNREKPKEYIWEDVYDGLISPKHAYIRTVKYDHVKNVIYYGGWRSPNIPRNEAGTGLFCLDGKTLKPIDHPFVCEDELGPSPINTVEIFYDNGHQYVFVGLESRNKPLKIFVDGKMVPDDKVNSRKIAEETGGINIITCASGIKVLDLNGTKILVTSSYSRHLSAVILDEITDTNVKALNWTRITQNPEGSKSFGAVHIGVTKDELGNPIIYSGRIVYGNSKYQPAAFVRFD